MRTYSNLLFLLFPLLLFSQRQISFSQLSVEDGLSQNSVVSIAQDSTGYLWFATQDGLNKYNGKEFIKYSEIFQDVTRDTYSKLGKVYVNRENDIYIITKQGQLKKLQRGSLDSFIPIPPFLETSTLLQDSEYTTWVGTYGKGLFRFEQNSTDTLQVFSKTDITKYVYAISEVGTKIYVAATDALFSIDKKTSEYAALPIQTPEVSINYSSMVADTNNGIWVGTFGNGLFYKAEKDATITPFRGFSEEQQIPQDLNIESLLYDSKNRLWIGTYGNGAFLIDFNTKTINSFQPQANNPKALHYNDVLCVYEDYTGNIWLGTDGGGLSFYDENLFKFNSLTNAQIPTFANIDVARAITVNPTGIIWVGTSGRGLTRWNKKLDKFLSYKNDPNNLKSIPSDRIMSLLSDGNALWIGFQDQGLSILEQENFINFNENSNPSLPSSTVWCIFKDSKNNHWLGTQENGLILFDRKEGVLQQYLKIPGDTTSLSGNNIRAITEGAPGELWIGTEDSGLHKLTVAEGTFKRYNIPNTTNIKSLYVQNNVIWIGTNGNGLVALDLTTEESRTFTTANGLSNNVIYGILPDDMGMLWLSSNKGLSSLALPESFSGPVTITNYDTYDGLQAREFNTGAAYKASDGRLFFGGLKGINWFHPIEISKNLVAPKSIIYKLELFNEEIPIVDNSIFNYKENTLTFTFSGLHFSQPERNTYQYILENYEDNWSKPNTMNIARYTNIPSGDYVFKVLSSNYDGIWETEASTYIFTIKPPWYLTIWAKLAYILAFLLLLYLAYAYLKWKWRMQLKLQLQQEEAVRFKKLDELKTKLYTNISHEFRTPLTLITGPVNQLLASSGLAEKNKKSLYLIENSSKRMLQLVNQLLDLSKLEEGTVRLQVQKYELRPQLLQLIESFTVLANDKGIGIKTVMDEFSETWYDSDVLEKIVSNLLSNAIKYSPENSEIYFSAEKRTGFLHLNVANRNDTLTKKDLPKVFERFYQKDKAAEGVGIGLSLIQELVLLSNGTISVKRKDQKTVCFTIALPIEKEKYRVEAFAEVPSTQDAPDALVSNNLLDDPTEIPIILVVEDNIEIRKYIVSLFEEHAKVLEAQDGEIGIAIAIEAIPDLIISDIMMPKKDGVELCNTLKSDSRTSHIPILLLTAKIEDAHKLEGLSSKANDYITKPFNAEILKQKVKNQIENQRELRKRYSKSIYLRPSEIAVNDPDVVFLEGVQKIIDSKFTDPTYKTTHFAKDLNLSRMQLHRKLKALTGLSTTEFLRSQRLKLAISLLESSQLTVSEIAYSVGFNTPSYFIKCFKETYHTTPAAYVNK